jgi:hypothetical protein
MRPAARTVESFHGVQLSLRTNCAGRVARRETGTPPARSEAFRKEPVHLAWRTCREMFGNGHQVTTRRTTRPVSLGRVTSFAVGLGTTIIRRTFARRSAVAMKRGPKARFRATILASAVFAERQRLLSDNGC